MIWLLSCCCHGRGSPGLVVLTPIRGVDLFVGLILHQLGENGGMGCDRLFGGVAQVSAEFYSRPFIVSKSKGIQLAAECLLSSCCSDIKERSQ